MIRAVSIRRTAVGLFAAGAAAAALTMPTALAQDDESPEPTPTAADAPATAGDCNASTLAQTVSQVTAALSQYFAAHPDANQALIDITRQPAFVAVGQMDGYFNDHPDQANDIRGIQAPLAAYKDRCGLQVSPTDALTALADV
jgi:hemophore-related protein